MEMLNSDTEKRGRKKNFTKDEILALCEFVKHHQDKLFCRAGHSTQKVEARKRKYWNKAAEMVRATGGGDFRSGTDLKKKWCDLKVLAKKYDIQKHKEDGGPPIEMNPIYEAVLAAMTPQPRDGISVLVQDEGDHFINDHPCLSLQGSSNNSQLPNVSFPRPQPSPPSETSELSPTPGTSCPPWNAAWSTGVEYVRGFTMQEEMMKIEQAKLEVEREKLKIMKETLSVHKQILAVLENQTLPNPGMMTNEN